MTPRLCDSIKDLASLSPLDNLTFARDNAHRELGLLHRPFHHQLVHHLAQRATRVPITPSSRMAIYPTIDAQTSSIDLENSPQPINIESWTEQLNPVSLISPAAEGTSAALAIDLDKQSVSGTTAIAEPFRGLEARREPLRRDSLKRRDALLKGKEGSRRRTRWENGSYQL